LINLFIDFDKFFKDRVLRVFDHGMERLVNDKYDGLFYFPEDSLNDINAELVE